MIREASVYDLRKLSPEERAEYGICVLTTRRWIQGLSWEHLGPGGLWLPDAAPSKWLLEDWQAANWLLKDEVLAGHLVIEWQKFLSCYRGEQLIRRISIVQRGKGMKPETIEMRPVVYLAQFARTETVTVLCWEREVCQGEAHPRCHRVELVEMVKQEMVK